MRWRRPCCGAGWCLAPTSTSPTLPAFVLAVVATVVALGLLGLVLGSSFVLYRNSNALSNALEYPVWLVCGLLVPLSLLPGWTHPLAYVLAPTWGVEALRAAAIGGNPWLPLLWCRGGLDSPT